MNDKNITKIVKRYKKIRGNSLIAILQDIQDKYKYIPEDAIKIVSKKLDLPLIDVYGVATFYKSFRLKPRGKHLITVCLGTACHVRGASRVLDEFQKKLNIKVDETTPDKMFTLETVYCIGACALGPMVVIDDEYHGQMTPSKVMSILKNIRETEHEKIKFVKRTRNN